MAVFTPVSREDAQAFLARYDLAELARIEPILAGIENTNYRLELKDGRSFALTLFERHQDGADLPFLLGFAAHLAAQGFAAAHAVRDRSGKMFTHLLDRPAALVRWVEGAGLTLPTSDEAAQGGAALARMHDLAADFGPRRANPFGPARWDALINRCADAPLGPHTPMLHELSTQRHALARDWPHALPHGAIHADYFPDNVLFASGRLSGVIDFGFACTDFFAYDLAIALNAWGFDQAGVFRRAVFASFLAGYRAARPLESRELAALPILTRGAALRFTLSRLHDLLFHDPAWQVIPKDPAAFFARLGFLQNATTMADYLAA